MMSVMTSVGQLVRVIHDFQTSQKGEITVLEGDIVKVSKKVDENWLCGFLNGVEGRFPASFVEEVMLPTDAWNKKLFAVIDDFPSTQDGDLCIMRGDIIEGLGQVDENWWRGKKDDRIGIFPVTCVTELEIGPTADSQGNQSPIEEKISGVFMVQAVVDVVPQLEEELAFTAGDVILVTKVIDKDWYMGYLDGKEGLVSSVCVKVSDDNARSLSTEGTKLHNITDCNDSHEDKKIIGLKTLSFSSENTRSYDTEITPYARSIYSFQGQTPNELTFNSNEIVTLIQHIDDDWMEGELDGKQGLFPASYVEIIVDCPYTVQNCKANDEEPENSGRVGEDCFTDTRSAACSRIGLVLHSFETRVCGDLKVQEGDTVMILETMDENWIQAEDDSGNIGLVPLNHIEVIGEGPIESVVENRTKNTLPLKDMSTRNIKLEMLIKKDDKEKSTQDPKLETMKADMKQQSSLKPKLMPKPKIIPKQKFELKTPTQSKDSALSMSDDKRQFCSQDNENSNCKQGEKKYVGQVIENASKGQSFSQKGFINKAYIQEGTENLSETYCQKPFTKHQSSESQRVPQRPAPPVPRDGMTVFTPDSRRDPVCSSTRRPPPTKPLAITSADLMSFSPECQVKDIENEVNAEVIGELKNRIAEIQCDVQSYEKSCEEMSFTLRQVGNEEKKEIKEALEDKKANIQGLKEELNTLRENLYKVCPAEKLQQSVKMKTLKQIEDMKRNLAEEKQKRKEKREKVIQELIDTEKDYLYSLHLCIESFLRPTSQRVEGLDIQMVFGNIEEIADVSQRLLSRLECCVQAVPFHKQRIGHNFVDFAEDMKDTYAPYCRNHDAVITVLAKSTENQEIMDYINSMINRLRQDTNVFDLESLLIKPIQRILKYPLLLNELYKATEESHIDKEEIMEAIKAMTDVATAINEYKRRKDLVYKYKKDSCDQRLSEKIARINFHSIRKKSSRMRGRLSTNLGLGLQTKDENFEKEEICFRHIEKAVRVFQKNVVTYMEQLQECFSVEEALAADIVDFCKEDQSPELQQYHEVQKKLVSDHLFGFKSLVEELVINPLSLLIQMFNGPNKVIDKRFDKLLDYDNQYRKTKDGEKSDVLQMAKNDYEAMNAQLLDELPKLYKLALQMLTDCVGAFTQAQKSFTDNILKETYSVEQLPLLIRAETGVVETFNISHVDTVDKLSQLEFVPRGFNPKLELLRAEKNLTLSLMECGGQKTLVDDLGSLQSDSQRVYLQQIYAADKLYLVTSSYAAADLMELSLAEGVMVAVIKDQDPMGNKEKWYVDDGVQKGFVPRQILFGWKTSNTKKSSPMSSESSLSLEENEVLLTPTNGLNPCVSQQTFPKEETNHEYYYAEYVFSARTSSEVSMFEGQVIMVLAKTDLEGNSEWWLVDADGQQGYVPANYLRPMN